MRWSRLVPIVLVASAALLCREATAQEQPDLEGLSLEELMNVHVVTASNMSERLSEAPATVIVITREDIRRRGYRDFSRILDDLPGMNVVRPYGATYVKNYWRGYRNTIGDPFLIMIDGVVFNHLYFNTTDVMTTFPLTNVERIEVVYGPASSVYGANAFMGVINVITRNDELQPGFYETTDLAAGSNESRLIDTSFLFKAGEARIRLTARIDEGDIDRDASEHYEYSKKQYAADRRLWGGFLDIPRIAGSSSAPRRNRGFDLRLFAGNLEAALQHFRLDAGYGVEYATDRSQNQAVWSRPDTSAYVRYMRPLSPRIRASTMVRYRSSGVDSDSYFTESLPGTPAAPEETVAFSYWSSRNSSWSLFQDFDVKISEALGFRAGVRWEEKDLQTAYDLNYGPALPVSLVSGTNYPFPEPPGSGNEQNRIDTEDTGVFVQSWYRISEQHRLNVGIRSDHNSKYGEATTLRIGYVGHMAGWGLKALYGQAFQEPNNRLLYGGWDGSGSDPRLHPERSTTIELSAERTSKNLSQLLSVYHVRNRDTFVNTVHTAKNLGAREVAGLDYHARAVLPIPGAGTNAWLYYSRLFRTTEKKLDANGLEIGEGSIGDLARDQIRIGITAVHGELTATLRGRYIGAIDTVETNPVRSIGGYGVLDAFFRADRVLGSSLGVSLSIDNAGDRTYFHPGVRDANAGTTPGFFDAAGVWQGSRGYYNSLLAQPGRVVMVGIHFNLPR